MDTSGHIAFTWTQLGDILLRENVMAQEDNAWGPEYEIGHIHHLLSTDQVPLNHLTTYSQIIYYTNTAHEVAS